MLKKIFSNIITLALFPLVLFELLRRKVYDSDITLWILMIFSGYISFINVFKRNSHLGSLPIKIIIFVGFAIILAMIIGGIFELINRIFERIMKSITIVFERCYENSSFTDKEYNIDKIIKDNTTKNLSLYNIKFYKM